jgi:Protein of unknown function (DUF973)
MSPSTPPASDERPDLVSPVYFDPAAAAPDSEGETPRGMPPNAEATGVHRAQLAALCSTLGIAMLLIAPLLVVLVFGLALPIFHTTFGTAALTLGLLELILGLIVGGAALQLVAFGLYTSAFGRLRWVDARFGAPRALSVVGLVGFGMLFAGLGGLLALLLAEVSCAVGGSATSCVTSGEVWAVIGLTVLGSILCFVGWIGILIGLFQLGRRYESGLLKAAGILIIVPVANVVAPVLALVGLHAVPKRWDLAASQTAGGNA